MPTCLKFIVRDELLRRMDFNELIYLSALIVLCTTRTRTNIFFQNVCIFTNSAMSSSHVDLKIILSVMVLVGNCKTWTVYQISVYYSPVTNNMWSLKLLPLTTLAAFRLTAFSLTDKLKKYYGFRLLCSTIQFLNIGFCCII